MHDQRQAQAASLTELDRSWKARSEFWARKLGRLRLGVEPIEDQLTRYRRVTWVLTAVPAFLSTFLFCLFAVFKRPDVGLVVAGMLFLPICSGAWLGYWGIRRRAGRYLAELNDYNRARDRLETRAPQ